MLLNTLTGENNDIYKGVATLKSKLFFVSLGINQGLTKTPLDNIT